MIIRNNREILEKSGFLHLTIERSSCQPSLEEDWVHSRIQRDGSTGSWSLDPNIQSAAEIVTLSASTLWLMLPRVDTCLLFSVRQNYWILSSSTKASCHNSLYFVLATFSQSENIWKSTSCHTNPHSIIVYPCENPSSHEGFCTQWPSAGG